MKNFQSHKTWKPSTNLYYGKYHSKVAVDISGYNKVNIDTRRFPRTEWRMNDHLHKTSVYSSNDELINYLLDSYVVSEITTPIGEQHLNKMQTAKYDLIIQEALYYNKFRFKLIVWSSAFNRSNYIINVNDEARSWLLDYHLNEDNESRLLRNRYSHFFGFPTLFLNNEADLMIFKLLYGSSHLCIEITEVVTFKELTN